jgi:hypothetical protein
MILPINNNAKHFGGNLDRAVDVFIQYLHATCVWLAESPKIRDELVCFQEISKQLSGTKPSIGSDI